MPPGTLHSARRVQFRKESNQHAQSLPCAKSVGKFPGASSFSIANRSSCSRIPWSNVNLAGKIPMPGHRPLQFFLALSLLSPVLIGSLSSQELTRRPLRPKVLARVRPTWSASQILTSPLHGTTTLRFSPDGRHFLLQDASGLLVVSREPFRVAFCADAPDAYLARLSNDSQTVSPSNTSTYP